MSNPENKPRVILILQYLMKNTDDLHTVTISDITEHLKASGIEAPVKGKSDYCYLVCIAKSGDL